MKPSAERERAAYAWASAWCGQSPEHFVYLSGGYSNANYRMAVDAHEYVVRFCDREAVPGIDREREQQHIAHAGALAAELVHFELPAGHMITRLVEGRHPLPGERQEGDLDACARLLKRIHALPRVTYRYQSITVARGYLDATRTLGTRVPEALARIAAEDWPSVATHFCHNDFNPWNLVLGGADERVLDWEWAGMGDPFFDLAGVVITHELDGHETDALLELHLEASGALRVEKARLQHAMRLYWLREGGWALLQLARGNQRWEIEQQLASSITNLSSKGR